MFVCVPVVTAGFDERHLVVLGVVAVAVFLATCTRRPQRRCRRCQEINRPHAIYCAQCGVRLPAK